MNYRGFIGGSYSSSGLLADQERTVNFYVERMESPGASTKLALYPMPALEKLVATNSSDGRAHLYVNGREFAVIGASLIEFDYLGTPTFRGGVVVDSNPATISSNGPAASQLFITSGGFGYLYNLATNVLSIIAALSGKATMGAELDGYFLALDASTGTMYSSELLDGATWTTGVMFAQRNAAPDSWVSMKVRGPFIWLQGTQTSEVWFDSGDSPFPFAKHPSGLIPYGIASPAGFPFAGWSAAVAADSLVWLAQTGSGGGTVMRAAGFGAESVTTYAVQSALNSYGDISDAYGETFQWDGHTFYVLSLAKAGKSWCLDLETGSWTELGTWDPSGTGTADFGIWRPRCHAYAFGEHRWLHGTGTGLYRMVRGQGTDVDGLPIRRLRRAPCLDQENERVFYSSFELFVQPGLGLTSGQGSDPQCMMRYSNDGGQTWTSERMASAGKQGEYGRRVVWERCGSGRRRVFEVSFSDPIPWRITGASIELGQPLSNSEAAA